MLYCMYGMICFLWCGFASQQWSICHPDPMKHCMLVAAAHPSFSSMGDGTCCEEGGNGCAKRAWSLSCAVSSSHSNPSYQTLRSWIVVMLSGNELIGW